MSIRTARRFDLLLNDAWTLPPSVARKTGCAAVMTMYDKAGGLTIYAVLKDMTAACATTALHVHWFCHYSWPRELISDNSPEYAGKLMAVVCHIYGVAKTFVAVGDSRAMGGCETSHHTIADVIEEADEKGEIRSERDLYIFCATDSIRRNQLLQGHSDECVNFELYFAQRPNTVFETVKQTTVAAHVKE